MSVTLIGHGVAGMQGPISFTTTTCTVNTVGADFIFIATTGNGNDIHRFDTVISDSLSNTWIEIGPPPPPEDHYASAEDNSRYFYMLAPSTSATHHFSVEGTGSGSFAIGVIALAGVEQTAPFDNVDWNATGPPTSLSTTAVRDGFAISTAEISLLAVTTTAIATIDGSFTALDNLPSDVNAPNYHLGLNTAWRLTTAGAGLTPTWSWTHLPTEMAVGAGVWTFAGTAGPAPPPGPTETLIRRQRIVALPFEANQLVFLQRLELFGEMGRGLVSGQGYDPVVLVQLSKDGGFTWGSELQLTVGRMGEYFRRAFINRLGRGRQWVVKLTMTDPVFSSWLDLFVDVDAGTQ